MKQLAFLPLDGFMKFGMSIFKKYVEKIHVSLKSAKNNEFSARRPVSFYEIILLNSS